jgi:hypothetical protein
MKENTGATSQLNIAQPETPAPPRGEGGQPENQNARGHGFYSKYAAFQRQEVMDEAAKIEGLDAEIVLLRSKIERLEEIDPDNVKLFSEVIRSLSLVMARSKYTGTNAVFAKARKIIGSFGATAGAVTGIAGMIEGIRK